MSAPPHDGRGGVFAAVAVGMFMAMLDGSIVHVALPALMTAFGSTFQLVQWVVLAYLAALTALFLVAARVGDAVGARSAFLVGLGVFTAASAACGLAGSVGSLVAARLAQATGAAAVLALGPTIVFASAPPGRRGRAIGALGAVASAGAVFGPWVGGLVLGTLSWRALFLLNLPLGIGALLVATRRLPRSRPAGFAGFDVAGSACVSVGLASLVVSIASQRAGAVLAAAAFAALAATALVAFIAVEQRARVPLVDLAMLRDPAFSSHLVASVLAFMVLAGVLGLLPFYLHGVLGVGARRSCWLMAAIPCALAGASPAAGILVDRVGAGRVALAGLCVTLVGCLALRGLDVGISDARFVGCVLPVGAGLGLFVPASNTAMLAAVAPTRRAAASGVLSVGRTFGQLLGLAILGAVFSARVVAYGGRPGDPTAAPAATQVEALHDALLVLAAVALLAIVPYFVAARRAHRAPLLEGQHDGA